MIQFVTDVDATKLRMAYNNDILRFYSDSAASPKYADVILKKSGLIAGFEAPILFSMRLYPNPQGQFYVNLQPYVAATINAHNFEDTLETTVEAGSPDSFMYGYSAGTVLLGTLYITIIHNDAPTAGINFPLTWLAGVQQQGEYTRLDKNSFLLLSPPKKDTLHEWQLKYWQGYPFDLSFYLPYSIFQSNRRLTVKNESNGLSQNFLQESTVNRLVFSDGRTDETLETVLPLAEGLNKLKFSLTQPKWVLIEKVPYRCGVYLKWLNALGGYSYWLFEDTYSLDRGTKHLGEIDTRNANLENSFGRSTSLGKESRDTLKIIAELLTEDERRIVEGLLDSPKIYLFTGKPFAQSSCRDWIEVSLKTSSARLKNPKQPLTNFAFDIELPQRYTQTL